MLKSTSPLPRRHSLKQRGFLAALSEVGCISIAARAAGVSRESHRYWLSHDPTYRQRFIEAMKLGWDAIMGEVHRRALGWQEPVFYRGRVVGTRPRHSDRLLIRLLEYYRPDVYGRRPVVARKLPAAAPSPPKPAPPAPRRLCPKN